MSEVRVAPRRAVGEPEAAALVLLGRRLVGAGGAGRALGQAVGAAVAAVLLLGVLGALDVARRQFEDGLVDVGFLAMLVVVAAVPAITVLAATGRIGSATRDRRLAALRLVGLSPGAAAAVAAVEGALPAAAGALVGTLAWLAARWAGALGQIGEGGWWHAAVIVPLVIGAQAALGAGAARRAPEPLRARSTAAPVPVSAARLLLPVLGCALLAVVLPLARAGEGDASALPTRAGIAAMLLGVLFGVTGVALSAPVLARAAGAVLVRSRRVTGVLAGRALQAEPLGPGRVIAGVGTAFALGIGVLAVSSSVEASLAGEVYPEALAWGQTVSLGLRLLAGSALGAGAVTAALAVLDQGRERRATLVRQRALGVPTRVLAGSALVQALAPLVPALALAGAVGMLAARGWAGIAMTQGLPAPVLPWVALAVGAAGALLAVGAAVVPTARARASAAGLRRE